MTIRYKDNESPLSEEGEILVEKMLKEATGELSESFDRVNAYLREKTPDKDSLISELIVRVVLYEFNLKCLQRANKKNENIRKALAIFTDDSPGMTNELRGELLQEFMLENKSREARAILVGSKLQKSAQSKKAANAKLVNDPRQAAKAFIKACWQVWQEEPERYKGKADFARRMLKSDRCKTLTSQKKIEDWCREWEKESITQPAE